MKKNIAIALLLLVIIGETGYIVTKKVVTKTASEIAESQVTPISPRPAPVFLKKGDNLLTSQMVKFVHKIDPKNLSDDAKKVTVGFAITSQTQTDGSTIVTFTPKDSDDQNQQYTVKTGQVLYFVEMTPADDKKDADKDLNYRDDYGIITDANGIIQ